MKAISGKPHLSYEVLDSGRVTLWSTCPFCGIMSGGCIEKVWRITAEGLQRWLVKGELIQRALPELDADSREQLISGVCPSCWEKTFNKEED